MQDNKSLAETGPKAPFAIHEGKIIQRENLWFDVKEVAACLPDQPYVFNLCENRYLFCVTLLAAASRGQVCLLPPSAKKAVIQEISREFPGAYLACESNPAIAGLAWLPVVKPISGNSAPEIDLDWEYCKLIAFTSGSTGKPKPCIHTLKTFAISAGMALTALGLERQKFLMVSTTPPQHMFGLETSVFWPLFSNLVLYDGRPFFPADIHRAIEASPWPSILATTPTHLRALAETSQALQRLDRIISATDVLPEKLARKIEAVLGLSPYEIYGSTETLSFASRRILRESQWRPYPGARLIQRKNGQASLVSPHLPHPHLLHDSFAAETSGCFTVLGRPLDMIKIGGKRASLYELNHRLRDIDGVSDGFFFMQGNEAGESRLTAVVVGNIDKHRIHEELRRHLDQVFLPRKIHFIPTIPRNETGKLSKSDMEKLLAELV